MLKDLIAFHFREELGLLEDAVDREEVQKGAELLGWELRELIEFVISVLEAHKEELLLSPSVSQ